MISHYSQRRTKKALVIGSGVMGLQTCLELLHRNIQVHLHSAYPSNHSTTCSYGSGALWTPYKCEDYRVSNQWAMETLDYLLYWIQSTKNSKEERKMVEIIPTVHWKKHKVSHSELPVWTHDARLQFQQIPTDAFYTHINKIQKQKKIQFQLPNMDSLLQAGYTHAWFFYPPVIDAPKMLQNMFRRIEAHSLMESTSGNLYIHPTESYFPSIDFMIQRAHELDCDFVMNCTGYGSSKVCEDPTLQAGRGILLHYDRHTCVREDQVTSNHDTNVSYQDVAMFIEDEPWATSPNESCYMIPRGDLLLIGGSFDLLQGGATDCIGTASPASQILQIQRHERNRLLLNAERMGIDIQRSKPIGEWVGLRPFRTNVRVEMEERFVQERTPQKMKVIHNYGHGGSGWTVFVGAVREAVNLALETNQ